MKKNILFIIDIFPPYSYRGGEISTYLLAKAIANKGAKCYVLTSRLIKPFNKDSENIFVIPKLIIPFLPGERTGNYFLRLLNYSFSTINNIFWLIYVLYKHKIDIIHSIPLFYTTLILLSFSLISNKSNVIDVHGEILTPDYMSNYIPKKNKSKKIYIYFSSFYDFSHYVFTRLQIKLLCRFKNNYIIVTPSEFLKKILVSNGYKGEKIKVICNLTSSHRQLDLNSKREYRIIFAGALEVNKGVWDVIHAHKLVDKTELNLEIYGNGTEKTRIIEYINSNRIKNISVKSEINHDELLEIYSKSMIIVAPSQIPESFGRFIQEAAITETPLITTDIGAIPENIIHNHNGILVQPGNIGQIANAVNRLLDDEKLYRKISYNIGLKKMDFSEETILSKRLAVYDNMK